MKSFFVIKGSPDRWFDQQGYEMEMVDTNTGRVPFLCNEAEDPQDSNLAISDPNKIPMIYFGYHVVVCKDEQEVIYLAHQQNSLNEL